MDVYVYIGAHANARAHTHTHPTHTGVVEVDPASGKVRQGSLETKEGVNKGNLQIQKRTNFNLNRVAERDTFLDVKHFT